MAVPNDRRIIWGTHVIPQIAFTAGNSETREEGSTVGVSNYEDWKLDTTVAKRFGGKGSVDIHSEQDIDGWVSFFSPIDATWDLRSETGGADDDKWEDTHVIWDGERGVTTTGATLRSDSVNTDFLYIKNTGSVECKLTFDGGTNYFTLIPPGAAVSMRINSVSSDNIKVATASSTTTIEYVIAKTP